MGEQVDEDEEDNIYEDNEKKILRKKAMVQVQGLQYVVVCVRPPDVWCGHLGHHVAPTTCSVVHPLSSIAHICKPNKHWFYIEVKWANGRILNYKTIRANCSENLKWSRTTQTDINKEKLEVAI